MTPFYQDESCVIYHGDCREVLPSVQLCDALITDPPYGVGFSYDGPYQDDKPGEYARWMWPAIELAESRLKPTGLALVFQSAKWARLWAEWFPREWKPIAIPKVFVQMRRGLIISATDYVLLWAMPEAPNDRQAWQPDGARDWFVSHETAIPRRGPERGHPCPRPGDMMRYLIACTVPPGGLIVDPFMGSGTTLVEAARLGRKAIGIEINEAYCRIAVERLAQGSLGLEMEPVA